MEQHQRKRAANYFEPFRPLLQAQALQNVQILLLKIAEGMAKGCSAPAEVLGAAEVKRLQLAQSQQAQQQEEDDTEAHKRELEVTMDEIDAGKSVQPVYIAVVSAAGQGACTMYIFCCHRLHFDIVNLRASNHRIPCNTM